MYPAGSVYICMCLQRNVTVTDREEMNLEGDAG